MTPSHRARLAAPVLVIYWLMVLGGLTLFTVTRADDLIAVAPLWLGAVAGTLLGQYLALNDFRFWIVALILFVAGVYCGPLLPSGHASVELWQAFIPAALCGFFSLGDRAVLAAAWFPIVLWMLTILDRNEQQLAPDGAAAALLGALVVLFVALLRARESRRVGLWRSVAAEPLARARPIELLREPPGRQLARAAWGLSVGGLTIALAVWLAPPLWQTETVGGDEFDVIAGPSDGLPCCPMHRLEDTESSRVREYFDLGLGHDAQATEFHDGAACRACPGSAAVAIVPGVPGIGTFGEPVDAIAGGGSTGTEITEDPTTSGSVAWAPAGTPIETPVAPAPIAPGTITTDLGSPIETTIAPEPPAQVAPGPAAVPDQATPPEPPHTPPPAAAPIAPDPPPPLHAAAPAPTPPQAQPARPATPHRSTARTAGPSLLRWLALLVIAALVLQLVRLALRPLRRLLTLRHLRRPFWDETVDQRVSNAWQLALIGLRDAGWRAGATEAPQQLARRAGVDGLERCATILERARHGVGIDADDLADMHAQANVAYRAARVDLGGFARALGWLRWPLT